ncbi:MAG: hypothetical protein M0R22_05575 [Dehalococcoidia bacterium]|nr:hypothetical protein [Dehalococcoidia bacterium]
MFGCTESGNSVLANIYGFAPYLYIKAPPGFTSEDMCEFRQQLEHAMAAGARGPAAMKANRPYIAGIELEMSQTILGYHGDRLEPFLRISTAIPAQIPILRGVLDGGTIWRREPMPTFESNILFPIRFLVDSRITGCGWVRLPARAYATTTEQNRMSRCQIEVDVNYARIENLGVEGEWSKVAPVRVLSFDIECAAKKGMFPVADVDPVIQIANLVTVHGESKPVIKNLFALNGCSVIPGADVLEFVDEREMLGMFRDFIQASDPDIITGYNIVNFDIPYLIDRGKALGVRDFCHWGRIVGSPVAVKESTFSSKAYGKRVSKQIGITGRIPFDVIQIVQREFKLRSYSLNFVSATYLGEQKEEVAHTEISQLFEGSADDRRRLGVYCLKDAYLPQRLCDKLMLLVNNIEMSRATGVPISFLLLHGQQLKVLTQLYRKAAERNMRIPYYKRVEVEGEKKVKYKGATVIEPVRGFHKTPVATLDFASLYPSIMIAHNLCYATMLPVDKVQRDAICRPEDCEQLPTGTFFVRSSTKLGVLPGILRDLLAARKKAKQLLAQEKDPARRAVYDARQLALKLCANSVYGVTGARDGKLPCTEVASSVTACGRDMIQLTKNLVESTYTRENGYADNAMVLYGDTDSVMVMFGEMDMKKVIELGKQAAALVSKNFPPPVSLEFEKVYFPYLLISKKRYAGVLWMTAEKPVKVDTKGIETVRRDNSQLVKFVMDTILNKILLRQDVAGAAEFVKRTISSLLRNQLDLSLLVISKALSKTEYAGKQAHVELAKKMRKRDAATAPGIGDRVPFVIVQSTKGAHAYEKAEDPLWALEKNLPIDYNYYIENQLQKPVNRIFRPVLGDGGIAQLWMGEHTRTLTRATPAATAGGIAGFVVCTPRCMGCHGPLAEGHIALCQVCTDSGKGLQVYINQLALVGALETKHNRAWTECQRCMRDYHKEILCTNRDCPIFYMRARVKKDLCDAQKDLDRLIDLKW